MHKSQRFLTTRSRTALSIAVGSVALLAATGCGGGSDKSDGAGDAGESVTVYSSFPLQGASRAQAVAMNDGAKLALKQANSKAGRFKVQFKPLDDSVAQTGAWDPAQVSSNARQAISDKRGVAYLGEYNSGATAISLPITNQVGMPQLTVSSSVGLTQGGVGTEAGEPDKYYPSGQRTLVRVSATDNVQGRLLAQLAKNEGCANVAVIDDQEVYGKGLASVVKTTAKELGLPVTSSSSIDKSSPNQRALAGALASKRTACFIFTGCTANGAVQLYKDVAASLPAAKLYGGDCVLTEDFFNPKKGGVPSSVGARVQLTAQVLPAEEYGPAGRKVFADYSKAYDVQQPDTYAIYGYQSMSLTLTALSQASDTVKPSAPIAEVRKGVLASLFALKDYKGQLGTFSIDKNGDLTLGDLAVYKIKDGKATFDRKETVGAPPQG